MPSLSRRDFLKIAAAGACTAAVSSAAAPVLAKEVDPLEQFGMLYDATMCVGCNGCTNACRQWNNTSPEVVSGLYDAPKTLSVHTWTMIQLYQEGDTYSFVKRACMHCVDPACVSGCPVHALQKSDEGPVTYDPDRCIGCRYCMYTCPFHVPRFEWDAVLPVVAKCTLCVDRVKQGLGSACAERCPTGALIWGKRGELIAEAEGRIKANPERYVDHIYGKDDAGGTSILYLSSVPFEKLGLDNMGTEPIPALSERTGNVFIPSILIGGPLLLMATRAIAKREGWA